MQYLKDTATCLLNIYVFAYLHVFQGWINTTLMFYAGYPDTELRSEQDVEYNLPLAYLLVGGSYFFLSLILMVRK